MSLYQRLLGHPFVYDHIRPLLVGGIDWSPLYRNLDAGPDDVILDLGCGTGIAHDYLQGFAAYYGFDTDPEAIAAAQRRSTGPNVHYECRPATAEDIAAIRPTRIIMAGLLHHLSDSDCASLLRMCRAPSVRVIATSDVLYLPRQPVNNLLAFLDRGKFVRRHEQYLELARGAELEIVREQVVRSHPTRGLALYLMMALRPPSN